LHHRRGEAATIITAILNKGALKLDPPRIEVDLNGLFAGA